MFLTNPKQLDFSGEEFIKQFEALRLTPYLDEASVPTIGWGNTYYEDGKQVALTDPTITKQRADMLFSYILKEFEDGIYEYLLVGINQNQFNALVSLAYNIGLAGFRHTDLANKININPKNPEIYNLFLQENKVKEGETWSVSEGLTDRRRKEANLYFKLLETCYGQTQKTT